MKAMGAVVATGAVSSVGLTSLDTALSHRAAAAGMREAPLAGPDGEPITMCFLPVIDPLLTGQARAAVIAARAFAEVVEALGEVTEKATRARLYLCVDEPEPGLRGRDLGRFDTVATTLVQRGSRAQLDLSIEVIARGAASMGFALGPAGDALARGDVDLAIVGGVHTDYDPDRIAALAEAGRLFSPDKLDALIPGEAAAFVAIVRPDHVRRMGAEADLWIHHAKTAHEKATPSNDEPASMAMGLSAALRSALSPLAAEGARAGWMLTDLTFETFRHMELSSAMVRTQKHFCEPQHVDSPAQRLGHLGAAAMPMHLVLATEACRRGFAPHPIGVSIAGSDGGERAAILFSAPSED